MLLDFSVALWDTGGDMREPLLPLLLLDSPLSPSQKNYCDRGTDMALNTNTEPSFWSHVLKFPFYREQGFSYGP